MKQWVKKLLDQLDLDWEKASSSQMPSGSANSPAPEMSEERATLLFILDIYNKHLIETNKQPIRKVRETLDHFARSLVQPAGESSEKLLFQLRQFFSSHRIDEYTYVQSSFEDFKKIIWDFADHLSEDIRFEQVKDAEAQESFKDLREAVESNSFDQLKSKSREFIDFYIKYQSQKHDLRSKKITSIRKNLNVVKKKLVEANNSMRTDHLTSAYNRRSFDEQMQNSQKLAEIAQTPLSLIILDIDFFKKINDSYGHDIGDFILQECVRLMKSSFSGEEDFLARIGGEEFAVILPGCSIEMAQVKAEAAMAQIRKEVFVHGKLEIRFTVSMGISQWVPGENVGSWLKRADLALYQSKNTGRNKYTLAAPDLKIFPAA